MISSPAVLPSTTTTVSPGKYALPACYGPSDPPTEEPTKGTFEFCADGGAQLSDMAWAFWVQPVPTVRPRTA